MLFYMLLNVNMCYTVIVILSLNVKIIINILNAIIIINMNIIQVVNIIIFIIIITIIIVNDRVIITIIIKIYFGSALYSTNNG